MDAYHFLQGRLWQFDKCVVHHGKHNTYSLKLKCYSYILAPLPPCQVKPPNQTNRVGNISEKALILSQLYVESSMSKGETVYTLLVLEKEEGEAPLHSLNSPLMH